VYVKSNGIARAADPDAASSKNTAPASSSRFILCPQMQGLGYERKRDFSDFDVYRVKGAVNLGATIQN